MDKNTGTTTIEITAPSAKFARESFRAQHPELRIVEQREGSRVGDFSRIYIFTAVAR